MKEQDERFIKKEHPWDWWFIYDKAQEYKDEWDIPSPDVDNLVHMSENQVVDLLNKLYNENRGLEKENEQLKNILKHIIMQIDKNKNYSTIMFQINNNDYDYFRDLMLEL